MNIEDIFNCVVISENIALSGQPTEAQFKDIAQAGFEHIIDLAPTDARYSIADESLLLKSLKVSYYHLPVDFNQPSLEDFEIFENTLLELLNKKVWIHCAANYRVSVFFGLFAQKHLGWTTTQRDALIRSIWESDENWSMSDTWKEFLKTAKTELLSHT